MSLASSHKKEVLYTTQAFILKITPYLENDLIVSLLISEGRRLDVFAKAAKKSTKRFGGALDLFQFVDCKIEQNHSNALAKLMELDLIDDGSQDLARDLDAYAVYSYFAELLHEFLREGQSIKGLYELISSAQKLIRESARSKDSVLLAIESRLLPLLGYWPEWGVCGRCQKKASAETFFLHPMECVLFCQPCQINSRLGRSSFLIIEDDLIFALTQRKTSHPEQARRLRFIFESLLHHVLGKIPKSYAFLNTLPGS